MKAVSELVRNGKRMIMNYRLGFVRGGFRDHGVM